MKPWNAKQIVNISYCDILLIIFMVWSDNFIQKTKKVYMDSRSRRNFSQLNTELQDVQRIMTQNIEDVLQRGEALSGWMCSVVLASACIHL